MSLKIFIGSSSEDKSSMEEIAEWIEDMGHIPCPWTDPKLFPLGSTTFGSLHKVAQHVDGAIFLFSENDTTWYRGDKTQSPRDNVLLEYGLFSGVLGESAVAIAVTDNPRIASDLHGITYLSLNRKVAAKNKLRTWLDSISNGSSLHTTLSRLQSPFQSAGKQSLFEKGTLLIKGAKKRIALVAKTPIPIVGTRPYGEPTHAIKYEQEQLETYLNLANAASNGLLPEFRCVCSIPALREDVNTVGLSNFKEMVRSNLDTLEQANRKTNSKFQLRWCDLTSPMTYVVADDKFLIWIKDSSGDNVWITAENDVIARALWDQSGRVSVTHDMIDIAAMVGLD